MVPSVGLGVGDGNVIDPPKIIGLKVVRLWTIVFEPLTMAPEKRVSPTLPKRSDELCSVPGEAERDKLTISFGETEGSELAPGLTGTGYLIPLLPGGIELERDEDFWRVPGKVEGPSGGIGENLYDPLHESLALAAEAVVVGVVKVVVVELSKPSALTENRLAKSFLLGFIIPILFYIIPCLCTLFK